MAIAALIKFTQGVTVGSNGQALVGVTGTSVTVANSVNDPSILAWTFELLQVPPGSGVVTTIQGPNASNTFTFTPDVAGSYRMRLTVTDGVSTDVDIRNFCVPFTNGLIAPPYQANPGPLPLTGPTAKPDEMNIGGQAYGWMGDLNASRPLLHQAMKLVDLLVGTGHLTVNKLVPSVTDGQVLTTVSGSVAWANAAGGGGDVPSTRTITAGAGLVGGGDFSADRTIDVAANADGSIVVNANDIQVGVLATNAQHGNRGGGSLHSTVTNSAAGFVPAVGISGTVFISNGTTGIWGSAGDPGTPSAIETIAVGSSYHQMYSTATPITDGYAAQYGTRLWHRFAGATRIAETFIFHLARSGSTYTLTSEDGATESAGATPSLVGTLDSGVEWRARVASGVLYIEVKESVATRYAQSIVWKSEECNA